MPGSLGTEWDEKGGRTPLKGSIEMENVRFYAFAAMQALAVLVLLGILLTVSTPWNAQRWAGTILLLAGLSLVGVARFQLGKSFAVTAKAHELVTHGLYSKIRNPVYVFGTVTFAGLILILQAPVLWIGLAVLVVLQTIRARREAAVLEAAFGDAYREYRRKTWF
jgi:protein-S-isoprenylcysteine O-methyltransferase Ste14